MLENMICGVQRGAIKTLIYGAEGVGKSTFCAQSGTAWICSEDGVKHLDVQRLPSPTSWQELYSQLNAYLTEPHSFWGLVVDSVDWCEALASNEVHRKVGKPVSEIPYGKGPGMVEDLMREMLSLLDQITTVRGMDVYLIAHAEIKTFDDPTGDSYSRWVPALSKRVLPPYKEWVDCILFAQNDSYLDTVGGGFSERKIAKGNGNRIMYCEHRPSHDAKNRFNLPLSMPLDHGLYRQAIEQFYKSKGI